MAMGSQTPPSPESPQQALQVDQPAGLWRRLCLRSSEHFSKRRPRPEVVPVTNATWPVRSVETWGIGKSDTLFPLELEDGG